MLLASAIVMGGFVASKAIGVVRQAVIARAFGASDQLDAYYAAFKLPDLLLALIAGGAIATTFIPVFSEHLTKGDTDRAWRLASAVLNVLLGAMGLVALVVAFLAPWLVRQVIAPGFEPRLQALTTELLRIVLVSAVLFAASSLVMSVLQAHGHFLLPALADFFYDVGIIGGAVFFVPRMGIHGLALGVVVGALFHLLIQVPGLIRFRARYVPTLRTGDQSLRQLGRLMVPRILVLGMFQMVFLFTTSLASALEEGSITAINMGWIMMQMPEVVFAMAIATAVFPTLSRLASQEDQDAMEVTVSGALRAILFLTLPSVVGLFVLGRSMIVLLFQRGAFDERAVGMVYQATAAFSAGLIGHSLLELAARIFYAYQNTLIPFGIALGATALNMGLCVAFAPWLGQAGLALANSVAVSCQAGVLLWLGWRSKVRFDWKPVWHLLWRTVLASALMGVCVVAVTRWQATLGTLWTVLVGSAVGGGVYLGVMVVLSQEDVRSLACVILKRMRHREGS